MKVDFLSQAGKILKEHKQYKRQLAVFLCLAVIVTFGTVTALKLYGQAMTHKKEVLDCKYEVHEHTEECYEADEEGNLGTEPVCGYADYVVHVHNDGCYGPDGNLACTLEEHKPHQHTDECYVTEMILVCGEEAAAEQEGSTGTEGNDGAGNTDAAVGGNDAEAGGADTAVGGNDAEAGGADAAVGGNDAEADGADTAVGGSDAEADGVDAAASGNDAGAGGTNTAEQPEYICGIEVHIHDENCYADKSICGYEEEHVHEEACLNSELDCAVEEHKHSEECLDEEGNLVCEKEEHEHIVGCYDENGGIICKTEDHVHGEECLDGEGNVVCGLEEHTHIVGCYKNSYICGKAVHTHEEACFEKALVCELEEHEHTDECRAQTEDNPEEDGAAQPESTEQQANEEPSETPAESQENGEQSGTLEDSTSAGTDEGAAGAPGADENGTSGHVHTEACYQEVTRLICGEQELHIHDDSCYDEECFDEEGNLTEESRPSCGLLQLEEHMHVHTDGEDSCFKTVELTPEEVAALEAGAKLHIHEDACYDEEGNLICGHDATHIHQLECYDDAGKLICGYGTASHVHEDGCYDEVGNRVCGYETASHGHVSRCYDEEGNLICGYLTASHVHEESCIDAEGNLICGYKTASHIHDENCIDEEGNLVCGYEAASHIHDESCVDEDGNLICAYETAEEHEHDRNCYDAKGHLLCEYEEARNHEHDENCYDEEGSLICGYKGVKDHEHDEKCYDVNGELICGYETIREHEHDMNCYDEEGNLICGYEGVEDHEHDANCLDVEGNLICGYEGVRNHEHSKKCYDIYGELTCGHEGVENHVHTETCIDEEGNLICGYEVAEVFDSISIFKGNGYDVIAKYNKDAELPEDAKLITEEITSESHQEHYEAREAEYRAALRDEEASMRLLLKIGFYVEGENGELVEVEPKAPVTISVQFLDEEGLLEGSPITIVHFGEEGTEVLGGEDAVNNSTTFQTESFSEFAFGYGTGERMGEGTVFIADTFQYDDSAMHISFYIEGEAAVIGKVQGTSEEASNEQKVSSDTDPMMVLKVKVLDEDEERYQAYSDYLENDEDQVGSLFLQVMSCRLFYGDNELDLSGCKVTAQVEPARSLVDNMQSEEVAEEETSYENYFSVVSLSADGAMAQKNSVAMFSKEEISEGLTVECYSDELNESDEMDEDVQNETEANGAAQTEDGVETNEAVQDGINADETIQDGVISGGNEENGATEDNRGIDLAAAVTTVVNPSFFVQFYANLNVPESTTGDSGDTLPFIDTSKKSGLGRVPNSNDQTVNEISLGLNLDGTVVFKIEATEIYKQETKEFNPRLEDEFNINYLNSLRDNKHYRVKELWVLENKSEKGTEDAKETQESSTGEENSWTVYNIANEGVELAFTNNRNLKDKTDEEGRNYIVIEEGTVIRLVYDPVDDIFSSKATFYDYDISSGPNTKGSTMTTTNHGINSYFPEDAKNARFAFGNANMGTNFQDDTVPDGSFLNQYNRFYDKTGDRRYGKGKNTFGGLSLGLVKGMKKNPDNSIDVIFNDGVIGPSIGLFGNDTGRKKYNGYEGTGKTIYGNWNLNFTRLGDTFTLSSVSMSNNASVASGLEKFGHPGVYDGKHTYEKDGETYYYKRIWTNNFWPLDAKYSQDNSKILDPIFGGNEANGRPLRSGNQQVPPSDDDISHNSYFGMTYSIDFDLVEEYVGPLEYYFYGDDDMWVFLTDKGTGETKLVCDIGGVHSSVGEYVNLWDYIQPEKGNSRLDHDKKQYTLSIFYTERGASGSSCWMQFTLPQISQIYNEPYDPNDASLTIRKVAEQFPDSMKETEFPFILKLGGIYNKYTVRHHGYEIKTNGEGEKIENEKVSEQQISTEEYSFNLKSGEWLEVIDLPIGTTYWIEEKYGTGGSWSTTVDTTVSNAEGTSKQQPTKTVIAHGTIEGKVIDGKDQVDDVTVTYINTYLYNLPETGGSGTVIYTMAGAIVLVFGAGFMYKKKFSERRG